MAMNTKIVLCAAAFCLASATAAQAQINIQLGGPPVYEEPAPVYAPQPVYVEQYHHDHDPHFRTRDRDRDYWRARHGYGHHDEHHR